MLLKSANSENFIRFKCWYYIKNKKMMKKKFLSILLMLVSILLFACAPEEAPAADEPSEDVEEVQTIGNSMQEKVSIGYIGCSNTRETVEGYHYLGGKKMWDYERRYGSGTLLDWSRNLEDSKYWDVFDELLKKHPETKTIWWQLCIMDGACRHNIGRD